MNYEDTNPSNHGLPTPYVPPGAPLPHNPGPYESEPAPVDINVADREDAAAGAEDGGGIRGAAAFWQYYAAGQGQVVGYDEPEPVDEDTGSRLDWDNDDDTSSDSDSATDVPAVRESPGEGIKRESDDELFDDSDESLEADAEDFVKEESDATLQSLSPRAQQCQSASPRSQGSQDQQDAQEEGDLESEPSQDSEESQVLARPPTAQQVRRPRWQRELADLECDQAGPAHPKRQSYYRR